MTKEKLSPRIKEKANQNPWEVVILILEGKLHSNNQWEVMTLGIIESILVGNGCNSKTVDKVRQKLPQDNPIRLVLEQFINHL
jgi:hypothetical protein